HYLPSPTLSLLRPSPTLYSFFFFNDPAPPEIYTLSLHDALPISGSRTTRRRPRAGPSSNPSPGVSPECAEISVPDLFGDRGHWRSEEHTSELQSLTNLVCRLLLEKKKKATHQHSCHPVQTLACYA